MSIHSLRARYQDNMERNHRLDLLRVIAISMIVFLHSPRPRFVQDALAYVRNPLSYLTVTGLVLFFMISGALLLGNTLSTREFIKRRFSKIVWPTLLWTVFYLIVSYIGNPPSFSLVVKQFLSIPFFRQGNGVLWFMYTLAGLYLLTPILSQWLKKATKREVEFYLALWAVTLLYPYLSLFLDIDTSKNGILYYFSGYLGYYVLGFYLIKHYVYRSWHVILAIAISLLTPFAFYLFGGGFNFFSMFWSHSLPVAMMAFTWFVLINRQPNKRIGIIERASKLSFGVFFVHIFFMRQIIWEFCPRYELPDLIEIAIIGTVTLIISFFVSWLISRLPFSKYIIGV